MKTLLLKSFLIQLIFGNFAWAVNLIDVPAKPWPNSTVDKFASYACGNSESDVQEYLQKNNLPFLPKLVRKMDQAQCHLVYQASTKGFRAKADFGSAKSLVFNVSSFPIEFEREQVWGDSFDIWKSIHKTRPDIPQTVFVDQPLSRNSFIEINSEVIGWPQDYVVSGSTPNDNSFLLVTHQIFEGDFNNGERFVPFLNELQRKMPAKNQRSKLSWEGGDFVVLSLPKTNKTLLIYGDTITKYWAENLTTDEIEFVLKTELGVDEVLDGQFLSSHVDYTVLPIDNQRILFRKPFTQNRQFICDLAAAMMRDFTTHLKVNPAKLSLLQTAACNPLDRTDLKVLAEEAEQEFLAQQKNWIANRSMENVESQLLEILSKNCSMSDSACLAKLMTTLDGFKKVQASSPKVAEAYLNSIVDGISNSRRFKAYFELLRGQFLKISETSLQRLESVRKKLIDFGFKIISVPSPYNESSWAGVSYVNSLIVDKDLFIPSLGLGLSESSIRDEITSQAPDIKIHLVPAWLQISNNGGVHCSVKAIR